PISLLRYHQPEEASALAAKQLSAYPDIKYVVLGQIEEKRGHYEQAIEIYQKSTSSLSQIRLGRAYLHLKEYKKADEAFQKALDESSELIDAIGGRCLALSGSGETNAAMPLCRTAMTGTSPNTSYLLAYADLLTSANRSHEALEYYQKALKKGEAAAAPKLAAAYFNLGKSAESSGLTGDAIKFYQSAIALDAKEKNYLLHLSNLLLKQRRYSEALTASNAAIALDSHSALGFANKGIAAHGLGDQTAAQASFERALELDAVLPQALNGYCQFLRDIGGDAEVICHRAQNPSS
ncbi:MAG: tetratricopeptide repeat protein, partial [Desulfobacteraceae bacterium]|nr:tetratricopeptide repeat protein [Desulfobacteraceae bacterium]